MNELEIKSLLQAKLASSQHGQGAAFVSELFIDEFSRRADLVMANGKLSAFEIKSEKDSLDRLDGQLSTYVKLFEQVTVVCAERHQAGVQNLAPENVGIWLLTAAGSIKVLRRAKTQKQASHGTWLSFLPVDEIRLLLAEHHIPRAGTRDVLLTRASRIEVREVRLYVLDFFKNRRETRIAAKLARSKSTSRSQQGRPVQRQLEVDFRGVAPLVAIPRLVT
ncbi:sce7726 family protein [Comamonas testosteroni]|uniref:sce7726 family protein n=1 Tax=Comamonas testosteroni TaxID=285 RepID=UPI00068024AF|nr:sce7726 family protein [Comamonas testosteroni]